MATPERVIVPREVFELYQFMALAFVPFTSQQGEIAVLLKAAKDAMLTAAPSAPLDVAGGG